MIRNKNFPIGVLDSGIGGLSIWREIVKLLPRESTIYIADSKHCPYGSRLEKEIYKLTHRLVKFLTEKNCKIIVLACNTITVSCLDKLRSEFKIPIIGTVPVVKTAAKHSKNKKFGILSTTRTAQSKYQKRLIERFAGDCEVINVGTDKLVPLIEKGKTNTKSFRDLLESELKPFYFLSKHCESRREILKQSMSQVQDKVRNDPSTSLGQAGSRQAQTIIDMLALGCSHFPLVRDLIEQVLGSNVEILDSGEAIARQTKRILENNGILASVKQNSSHTFFTTGDKKQFEQVFTRFLKIEEVDKVEEVEL